jgi:hypothetical protein
MQPVVSSSVGYPTYPLAFANFLCLSALLSQVKWGPRKNFPTLLEVEAIAQDHLHNQVIRAAGHSEANPKVNFPLRCEIQINGGKDLLLLISQGIKAADRAERRNTPVRRRSWG